MLVYQFNKIFQSIGTTIIITSSIRSFLSFFILAHHRELSSSRTKNSSECLICVRCFAAARCSFRKRKQRQRKEEENTEKKGRNKRRGEEIIQIIREIKNSRSPFLSFFSYFSLLKIAAKFSLALSVCLLTEKATSDLE